MKMSRTKRKNETATQNVTQPAERRYFRISEAAAYLGSTVWFVGAAIRNKKIPHIPLGKRFVIAKSDLDDFAAKMRVAA
jgi:excisionase family DNA binding protein